MIETFDRGRRNVPCGCLCVRQLQTGNDDKSFGKCHDDVSRCLDPDVNAIGRRLVDVMLEHTCIRHGDGGHDETSCHPQDGAEVDLVFAEQGIDYNFGSCQYINIWALPSGGTHSLVAG